MTYNYINTAAPEQTDRCFKRFDASKLQYGALAFAAFLCLTIGGYALAMNLAAGDFYTRTPFGDYWQADSTNWFLCLGTLLFGALSTMKALGLRRHVLLVTDEGVSGRVTGSLGQHPENFSLTWAQVLGAEAKRSNMLKLTGTDRTYELCLANHRDAEALVRRMLEKHREETKVASIH